MIGYMLDVLSRGFKSKTAANMFGDVLPVALKPLLRIVLFFKRRIRKLRMQLQSAFDQH